MLPAKEEYSLFSRLVFFGSAFALYSIILQQRESKAIVFCCLKFYLFSRFPDLLN